MPQIRAQWVSLEAQNSTILAIAKHLASVQINLKNQRIWRERGVGGGGGLTSVAYSTAYRILT